MVSRKRLVLFGSLACAVAAAVWVPDAPGGEDDIVASAVERATASREDPTSKARTEDPPTLLVDKLQRTPVMAGDLNPFSAKSWYVEPPPSPPPLPEAPPPEPTAPPLPFTYVGKLREEGGHWLIYLTKGEQSYAVSKGETFDDVYRLEGIENDNLVIQYLPLSTRQLLPIGTES